MMNKKELLEKLAEIEHQQWMSWAQDMLRTENISQERRKHWEQYFIPYNELPENIKELDRKYARKILEIIG